MIVCALMLTGSCSEVPRRTEAGAVLAITPQPSPDIQRGVSWVASREISATDFEPLLEAGVEWIVQTPFGWQTTVDDPHVALATSGRILWGERDEGLASTTRLASERGIRTLLKPHIWIRGGTFPGEIRMRSPEEWERWFESYETFILHYARLAEELDIEALCVGTELRHAAIEHPTRWRALIRSVRAVYGGRLTYAANWYDEFEKIEFWDDLDFIGIQAYFPLTASERPTVDELVRGWQPHLETIEAVQRRFSKPVVFTEIGYRSEPDAAIEPWRWPDRESPAERADLETQARCYEAFFRVFWDRPWFGGAHFWKWYPSQRRRVPHAVDFTPQNKPAEQVMARWYRDTERKQRR